MATMEEGPAGSGYSWSQPQLEIIDAAATAFMEGGYSATALNDVADVLSATKGRIYHYYRSKAALYLDVLARATCLLYAEVEPAAHGSGTPDARLHQMARTHCRITMERYPYFRVIAGAILDIQVASGDLQPKRGQLRKYIDLRDTYEDLFSDVIHDGTASGVFRDVAPRIASKEVLGVLNWVTMWYRPEPGKDIPSDIVAEIARFAVCGLQPMDRKTRR